MLKVVSPLIRRQLAKPQLLYLRCVLDGRPQIGRFAATRTVASTKFVGYEQLRHDHLDKIESLPETKASVKLLEFLQEQAHGNNNDPPVVRADADRTTPKIPSRILADSMLATFALHVESRVAALMGLGFYTIGPCGEETLAAVAPALQPQDSMALHYRHLSIQIARQLCLISSSSNYVLGDNDITWAESDDAHLSSILLDRARGYTVSSLDPVTGGVHCSIGSNHSNDYVVTSTLASQCSPAVGRALASGLVETGKSRDDRSISFVTLGDGSLHHGHFWSAFHLARHARMKRIKCPVVFGISDNGLSISYQTEGYSKTLFHEHDPLMPLYKVDGNNLQQVFEQTSKAFQYARKHAAPVVVLFDNLQRRFGHAATDRQAAYLTNEEIQSLAESEMLQNSMVHLVEQGEGSITFADLLHRWQQIENWTRLAFAQAVNEPKVTREDMLTRMQVPTMPSNTKNDSLSFVSDTTPGKRPLSGDNVKTSVMRKHMTRGLAEIMKDDETVVYLGEDVKHGGYYLVTESLVEAFPNRVIDFPPDETSLLGAGLGMSQQGLTPIVEIPYAKYLDCASDMYAEICTLPWLTNRANNPTSLLIRIQGFDRGLFGGNFHTHNSLSSVLLPGCEVVCFSNGNDWVRGIRHALRLVKQGQIVVFVDCTNLLNRRHVNNNDRQWETPYPEAETLDFDTVHVYRDDTSKDNAQRSAIVTYGNGVTTALQARAQIQAEEGNISAFDVVDCPCLNRVPQGLLTALANYDRVLFADICKSGPGSVFGSMVVQEAVHNQLINKEWKVVAAPRSYNPLGSFETFLNVKDIVSEFNPSY